MATQPKKSRRKGRFSRFLFFWTAALAVLVAVLLVQLWAALARYESTTPEAAVMQFLKTVQSADEQQLLEQSGFALSPYEKPGAYRDAVSVSLEGIPADREQLRFAKQQKDGACTVKVIAPDASVTLELTEKETGGYVVWVMGPACSFDYTARENFSKLIENGYVNALLAGNALATHDLEGALLGTALGQDIKTQEPHPNGHYNHLEAINLINRYGSIPEFIKQEHIDNGIIYSCVKNDVPFVLNGSIRDDGPLPEVYEHTYVGQDTIRSHVRKATTVIGMATVLHTIATGNMTPTYRVLADGTVRPVYFYMVDTSDFAASKLGDRGSLSAKGIVTNVQDFLSNVTKGLGL